MVSERPTELDVRSGRINRHLLPLATTRMMKHFCPNRTRKVGVGRIQAVIAIACFVAMAGCGDSIGPKTITLPKTQSTVSGLAVLAAELHNATDGFVQGVGDKAVRGPVEVGIKNLADQLLAGRVADSRAALARLRTLLASLDDISAIELAPVGLALDYIDRRINEIVNV